VTDDHDDTAPDDDRFGISAAAIRTEVERHRGIIRSGMYVPTRHEVRTAPLSWLAPVLQDWVWESPTLLIPSETMVEEVIAELTARPDADAAEVRKLIDELRGN